MRVVMLLAALLVFASAPSFGPEPDDCPQWVCYTDASGRSVCYCPAQ